MRDVVSCLWCGSEPHMHCVVLITKSRNRRDLLQDDVHGLKKFLLGESLLQASDVDFIRKLMHMAAFETRKTIYDCGHFGQVNAFGL